MIYQKSHFRGENRFNRSYILKFKFNSIVFLEVTYKKNNTKDFYRSMKIDLSPFTTSSDQNLVFSEVMIRTFNFAPNSEFDETFKIYKNNI